MKGKIKTGKEALIGQEALVLKDIDPDGKVMVSSELWDATAINKKFYKGDKVLVFNVDGLRLIVGDQKDRGGSLKG